MDSRLWWSTMHVSSRCTTMSPAPALRDFLEEVSRGNSGYSLWRYVLVEDAPDGVPRNSPYPMMAVWRSLLELIEYRQNGRQMVMPNEDLWNMLRSYDPDVRKRMEEADHPLNACSQMILENYRGIAQPKVKEWLKDVRDRYAGDSNLDYLVMRANGTAGNGCGIRWNIGNSRFEASPWTLPLVEAEEKPEDLRLMETDAKDGLRHGIVRALYRSGFSVSERMLDEYRGMSLIKGGREPRWQCTLQGKKALEVWRCCRADDMGECT